MVMYEVTRFTSCGSLLPLNGKTDDHKRRNDRFVDARTAQVSRNQKTVEFDL